MIDAHQHFWNLDEVSYYWMNPGCGSLFRNFVPSDLYPLTVAAGVDRTVVVQATSSMQETAWLLQQAAENDFIGGVVAWVDLTDPSIQQTLNILVKNPKFKGVRHQIEDEKDRRWILKPEVLRGLKAVEESGIAFDALLKRDQLWQLQGVLDACPALRVVIDHCAKPDIAHGGFDEWAEKIDAAAKLPVSCKLSGLFTEAAPGWTVDDIRPYAEHVLEVFGEDRVMFGSDWPVSTQTADYCRVVESTKALLAGLSESAIEKIMDGNARRFYKL